MLTTFDTQLKTSLTGTLYLEDTSEGPKDIRSIQVLINSIICVCLMRQQSTVLGQLNLGDLELNLKRSLPNVHWEKILQLKGLNGKWPSGICYAFKFVPSMNMLRHVYFKFS